MAMPSRTRDIPTDLVREADSSEETTTSSFLSIAACRSRLGQFGAPSASAKLLSPDELPRGGTFHVMPARFRIPLSLVGGARPRASRTSQPGVCVVLVCGACVCVCLFECAPSV